DVYVNHRRSTALVKSRVPGTPVDSAGTCSGVAIDPYHILTNAHCALDYENDFSGKIVTTYFGRYKNDLSVKCYLPPFTDAPLMAHQGEECANTFVQTVFPGQFLDVDPDELGCSDYDIALVQLTYGLQRYPDIGYYIGVSHLGSLR
ncbi:MAG: hypothetical protein ACE5E5_16020, partial [Phycisphaerae bacterium]